MSILYPADNLYILDYNRVLKSLGDKSVDEFMTGIKANFKVEPIKKGSNTAVKAKH